MKELTASGPFTMKPMCVLHQIESAQYGLDPPVLPQHFPAISFLFFFVALANLIRVASEIVCHPLHLDTSSSARLRDHLHTCGANKKLQQVQQQGLVQALTDLPQSLTQTVGAAVVAATNPARANPTLVDTRGLGKPHPQKNTESEFVSWARRTQNFVVSVHLGARDVLTWAVERESSTVAEANAATEVVMLLDTLRMLADQLCTVLMTLV